MNNKMAEPEEDGGFIYKSNIREEIDPGSSSLVPKFPNQEYHDISSNQVAAEKENGETSQNENDNISILYKSADRKAEEERMKKHKENDDNLPGLFVQSML